MSDPRENGRLEETPINGKDESVLQVYTPSKIEDAIDTYFRVPYGQEIRPLDIALQEPILEEVRLSDFETQVELVRRSLPIIEPRKDGGSNVVVMEYRRRSPFATDWKEVARVYGEGKVAIAKHGTYRVPEFTEDQLTELDTELFKTLREHHADVYNSPLSLVDSKFIPGVTVRSFEESVRIGIFDFRDSSELSSRDLIDLQGEEPRFGKEMATELIELKSPLILEPGRDSTKYDYQLSLSFPRHEQEITGLLHSVINSRYYSELIPKGLSTRKFALKAKFYPEVMVEMLYDIARERVQV